MVLFKTKKFYMSGSDVKIADRKLFIIGMLVFHEKEAEKECFMTRNLSRAFEKVDVHCKC